MYFTGIPTLGVPAIDPLEVEKYDIKGEGFTHQYFHSKLYGYLQAKITNAQ